ncbi:MAG: cell division protein ZipA [Colwellia sp.]|nr:cell division protein ZipA [Colwellia sp.]
MEDNLRITLIVLSVVVITAILVHGLWTIRKNKNPYKLKTKTKKTEKVEPHNRGFDGSGFDQDGVSKPRIIENPLKDEVSHHEVPMPAAADYEEQAASYQESTHENSEPTLGNIDDISKQTDNSVPDLSAQDESLFAQVKAETEESVSIEAQVKADKLAQDVYQTPITLEKPARKVIARPVTKPAVKRDQLEINFGGDNKTDVKRSKREPSTTQAPKVKINPEVLIVSVVMPGSQQISGAALLPTLLTLGMKFGDMNIFHRHEDNAGNGKVTFSLANIMNPGTFDLDNIESFTTQGVSLFMTLPNAGDAFVVFEQMLNAAKQLALEFNGQLLDDKRNVMTKQTEQHYTGNIREFERKNLIASA